LVGSFHLTTNKARFFQGDLLRIFDLQFDVAQLKQGNQNVSEYFTKLRVIWDEIENFSLDPTYSCKKVSELVAQRKLEDHAMRFLRGLNDQYSCYEKIKRNRLREKEDTQIYVVQSL